METNEEKVMKYIGCYNCKLKKECDNDDVHCYEYDDTMKILKWKEQQSAEQIEDLKEMIENLMLDIEIKKEQIEQRNRDISSLQKQVCDLKWQLAKA